LIIFWVSSVPGWRPSRSVSPQHNEALPRGKRMPQ